MNNEEAKKLLSPYIDALDQRYADVINLRFSVSTLYRTSSPLEDVAKRFKITRERVRQIESKALRVLAAVIPEDEFSKFEMQSSDEVDYVKLMNIIASYRADKYQSDDAMIKRVKERISS